MTLDLEATGIEGLEDDVPESLVSRLEETNRRYREVVVDASDGDPLAVAEARALEIQIASLLDEAKREAIAKQLRERQELAEREAQMREQQTRDREHFATVLVKRDKAFELARTRLAAFAASARALFDVEAEAQDAAGPAGERFLSERGTLSNIVGVVGHELGLDTDVIGWIPAMSRRRLMERFRDLLATETPEPAPVPSSDRCSVCAHEARDEIETALAGGLSYRDTEGRYGVSRSALTRHKAHVTTSLGPAEKD